MRQGQQARPQQCSPVLRADPAPLDLFHLLLKTHHSLPVPTAGAGEKETVRCEGLSSSSELSHSAVPLNTPMCACTHKLKLHLNSLNSLKGNLETMEYDLSYCLLVCLLEVGLRPATKLASFRSVMACGEGE